MTKTVSRLSAIVLAGTLAAATFSLYTLEASAGGQHMPPRGGDDGDRTEIRVDNKASISNTVSVTANTGGNDAEGGDAGRGGDGGDGSGAGMLSVISSNDGGNGGNSGRGGSGGTITTGIATAIGTVYNDVNDNRVVVEGCGCEDDNMFGFSRFFHFDNDSKTLRISASNRARVNNTLDVAANTGRNDVDGGDSARGGQGGDGYGAWFSWFSLYSDNDGGNGGNSGAGGPGGTIRTGAAGADGMVTNIANRNVVRVMNGDDDDEGGQLVI